MRVNTLIVDDFYVNPNEVREFALSQDFKVEGNPGVKSISCFTTRPDTLFGFSFLAVSVDHPISKLYENNKE